MRLPSYRPILFAAVMTVGGCSFATDLLSPSLTGEDPAAQNAPQQQAQAGGQSSAPPAVTQLPATPPPTVSAQRPPQLGTTNFETPGVSDGANTGTLAGQKVTELRAELSRLQKSVSENNKRLQDARAKTVSDSQRYHNAVSAINARLQVGTTPGNPILVEQFNQALSDLEKINEDVGAMNEITTGVTNDSTLANFISENTRAAFRLSGAVDADHQQLAILEDEVNRTVVLIDRLLKELSEDIQRQTNYIASERSNLNTLSVSVKTGEILGASLGNRSLAVSQQGAVAPAPRGTAGRRALVIIRFDRPNVAYDQALYTAVSRALERQPSATFELVAVTPNAGGTARVTLNSNVARRNAENVMRTLQQMGLPPQRVAISAQTNAQAQSNEVHLYLN